MVLNVKLRHVVRLCQHVVSVLALCKESETMLLSFLFALFLLTSHVSSLFLFKIEAN